MIFWPAIGIFRSYRALIDLSRTARPDCDRALGAGRWALGAGRWALLAVIGARGGGRDDEAFVAGGSAVRGLARRAVPVVQGLAEAIGGDGGCAGSSGGA